MNLIRIIFINLVVLFAMLLVIELSFRIIGSIKDCVEGESCKFEKIFFSEKNNTSLPLDLVIYDYKLGYVLSPGWSGRINNLYWKDSEVNIDAEGFRSNGNYIFSEDLHLAVGDSFTFGNQLSDNETWVSCLEKKTGVKVLNGGIFGYGAAQSVLRAEEVLKKNKSISKIYFSVLVGDDIYRDLMSYRTGYPKPFLTKNNEKIEWVFPKSFDTPGTKNNPRWHLLQYSYFYTYFSQRYFLFPNFSSSNFSYRESYDIENQEIIDFVLNSLKKINREVLIILQYPKELKNNSIRKERKLWLSSLEKLNLKKVDTYNVLIEKQKLSPEDIWYGHHTKYGNKIVCEEIYDSLKSIDQM